MAQDGTLEFIKAAHKKDEREGDATQIWSGLVKRVSWSTQRSPTQDQGELPWLLPTNGLKAWSCACARGRSG